MLGEVVEAYASQRVQLLSSVLGTWISALSHLSDIVNMLRVTCAQLLQVCEAELRLFQKLFGHDLSDEIFVMEVSTLLTYLGPNRVKATPRTLLRTLFSECCL